MEEKKCEECGKLYIPKAHNGRWCSQECYKLFRKKADHEAREKANPLPEWLLCKVCGKEFKPTTKSNTVCSDECRREIKNKTRRDKTKNQERNPRICLYEECSKFFVPTHHKQEFCSDRCRNIYTKEYKAMKGKEYLEKRNKYKQPMIGYCFTCCKFFIKNSATQKYCSEECRKIGFQKYLDSEEYKITSRTSVMKRRAAKKGNKVGKIDINWINERDGFKCQICFKKVDFTLKSPHPMSASYDHIYPLSRGGEHSNANLCLTHRICNTKKLNTVKQGVQPNLF